MTELIAEVNALVKDDPGKLLDMYDIRIYPDGTVYDDVEWHTYPNVVEWAKAQQQNDSTVAFQKRTHSSSQDNW